MVRRIVMIIVILGVLAGVVLASAAYTPPGTQTKAASRSIPISSNNDIALENRLIHDQVSLLNLVNALWLSGDQLEEIIAVLEPRMNELEKQASRAMIAASDPEFGSAMLDLKAVLMEGNEADSELRDRVNKYSGPNHSLRLDYEALQEDIASVIMPILSENQLYILGEYKPCLFNQNDPLHPERIGQASNHTEIIDKLKMVRKHPSLLDSPRIQDKLKLLAARSAKNTPFAVNVDDEFDRLMSLIENAVAMSDEEFALEAENIAEEMTIYLETKDQMIADHYNLPTGIKDRRMTKLARIMVIPGALEIFEARIDALNKQT